MKAECNAPIGLDRHQASAAPVASQRVKPKQRQRHVFWTVGGFQHRENLLRLLHQIGPDSAAVVLLIQPPHALVLDSFDQGCLLPVYSEALHYTTLGFGKPALSHRSYTLQASPMVRTSFAHHRGCCQQSQQPELREPAKEKAIVLPPGKPGPGGPRVHAVGPTQGQPYVEIRQIGRRTDSPCRDYQGRAYLSFPPVVPSRAAIAAAGIYSRWLR